MRLSGSELKLLFPLKELHPDQIGYVDYKWKFLQPIQDLNYKQNLADAINYCLENPEWRLSLQQHKILNLR